MEGLVVGYREDGAGACESEIGILVMRVRKRG